MEYKNLITLITAMTFIVLSLIVLVLVLIDYRKNGKKLSDSATLVLFTAILCLLSILAWKAYPEPKVGDLRVQCVGENYADFTYEISASGTSKPVKYKRREIACSKWQSKWQWEVRIEDREGEYHWAPVVN